MGSGIVPVEVCEHAETRPLPVMAWLQLSNVVTLALLSLITYKLYKALDDACRWITAPAPRFDHIRSILFLGPKNDFNIHLLQELSSKFNTPVVSLKDAKPTLRGRRVLLNGEDCMGAGSQVEVDAFSKAVINDHGPIDLLLVSEQPQPPAPGTINPTHFLSDLNRQLLAQFRIVTAFLPAMLSRNRGSIVSIALDRTTSLANAGVMKTLYEDLVLRKSDVTLTLIERNTFVTRFLPALPTFIIARLAANAISTKQMILIPSFFDYLVTVPLLFGRIYLKPFLDFLLRTRTDRSR